MEVQLHRRDTAVLLLHPRVSTIATVAHLRHHATTGIDAITIGEEVIILASVIALEVRIDMEVGVHGGAKVERSLH
jgi:predicted acyltransferase (DUF342 family)